MKTNDSSAAHIDPILLADLAPYRLLREIGRGGMSVVYEALDTRTGQRAALKVLALPFSVTAAQRTELIARFRREERVVNQLSHSNIVAIQEIGERTGVHFIAMEFLPGESLRARLERGPLPLPEAAAVLTQIAGALEAVHGAGIVHRDVKPSNIMLLPDGGAKLLDFGVARHSDDTAITSGGLVVGSPAYLAPEQVRGGAGTTASDVWALGVLLYEMLAGHPPFQATDVAAVMYQVIHEPPPPLAGLPPGMAKVLKRALDKAPERRFPSASALAEAFAASLPAERPAAAPPSLRPPAAPLRWAWGLLPLLFGLALVWGLSGRRAPAPPPSLAAVTPVPAPTPVSSPANTARAIMAAPPAAVSAAPSVKPSAQPHLPLPVKVVRVKAVRVTPPVRRKVLAQTLPAAPPRHAVQTARRSPAASPARPHAPRLLAENPPRPVLRPPVHFPKPSRPLPAVAETPLDAPPIPSPSPASRPAQFRPQPSRPKPSKADEDAAGAARLQKFIWSEGR